MNNFKFGDKVRFTHWMPEMGEFEGTILEIYTLLENETYARIKVSEEKFYHPTIERCRNA